MIFFLRYEQCFWAAAPKGMKSCRTQGEYVHLSVLMCIYTYVRPTCLILKALSPSKSFLTQRLPNSPNRSNMAKIYAKWPKSKSDQNLGISPSVHPPVCLSIRLSVRPSIHPILRYLDSDQIWAILLGFGPSCLDLGHFA